MSIPQKETKTGDAGGQGALELTKVTEYLTSIGRTYPFTDIINKPFEVYPLAIENAEELMRRTVNVFNNEPISERDIEISRGFGGPEITYPLPIQLRQLIPGYVESTGREYDVVAVTKEYRYPNGLTEQDVVVVPSWVRSLGSINPKHVLEPKRVSPWVLTADYDERTMNMLPHLFSTFAEALDALQTPIKLEANVKYFMKRGPDSPVDDSYSHILQEMSSQGLRPDMPVYEYYDPTEGQFVRYISVNDTRYTVVDKNPKNDPRKIITWKDVAERLWWEQLGQVFPHIESLQKLAAVTAQCCFTSLDNNDRITGPNRGAMKSGIRFRYDSWPAAITRKLRGQFEQASSYAQFSHPYIAERY